MLIRTSRRERDGPQRSAEAEEDTVCFHSRGIIGALSGTENWGTQKVTKLR